ncbi:permease for cytosine/purines, uracil, thiamine, allantoin-domain-containing protein [Mycena olivaceomarginata]|nr:permease for cytosine/purines, uracil, thiamine, allantoin-domain-containing protein [Mycena olivaceomarginata]
MTDLCFILASGYALIATLCIWYSELSPASFSPSEPVFLVSSVTKPWPYAAAFPPSPNLNFDSATCTDDIHLEIGRGTTPLRRLLKYIEVPIDANADYKNDHYTNRDLYLLPLTDAHIRSPPTLSIGAISGMSPQAIGALVIGAIGTGCLSVACGWMGERHHIGFTVASRFTWGMRGAYFPVIVSFVHHDILGRPTSLLGWAGHDRPTTQIFVIVTLGAMIPGLAHMSHTLAGGMLLTKDLIGMIIMRVPPERLQRPVRRIERDVWGDGGDVRYNRCTGSWHARQSDWTRYAGQPYAPTISQLVAAPFCIILCATVGIIVTSCGEQIFGALIWEPFALLAQLQEFYHDSSRVRVAVFFAGVGCVCAQLGISIVLNSVSAGMDLAGLAPRYMNIRRGAYLLAVLGLISNPWQYLSKAATFLTVISGFGIFFAPFTGVMLADYLVVRRGIIKLEDCYIGDSSSLYWYNGGFHWRALVAWALGVFPTMPGLVVMTMQDAKAYNGWIRIFNIAFFVGQSSWSGPYHSLQFWVICNISPPPGVGVGINYHDKSRSLFAGPPIRTERLDNGEEEGTEKMMVSV